jgi:hypothetical protein
MKVNVSIRDVANTVQKNMDGIYFTFNFAIGLQQRFYKKFGSAEVFFFEDDKSVELTPYKWEGVEIYRM